MIHPKLNSNLWRCYLFRDCNRERLYGDGINIGNYCMINANNKEDGTYALIFKDI